jgi:hypothetical protein
VYDLVAEAGSSEATEFAPAMDDSTGILPGLPSVKGKPVHVAFDGYSAAIWMGRRIASPGMLPKADPLPHLICSRPMFFGGVKDEADQHGDL